MMGQEDDKWLLSNDAGYGFICNLSDMQSKNKAGKALINLPKQAEIGQLTKVTQLESPRSAAPLFLFHICTSALC